MSDTEEKHIGAHPNPFPGLRPFRTHETHLFFGREGQIDEVLAKLERNKFVAVLGTSGSGKSSLMYCGLIPNLQGGFMTSAGANWRVIVTRPGVAPIANLSDALTSGEEFELLFTMPAEEARRLLKRKIDNFKVIGEVVGKEYGFKLIYNSGKIKDMHSKGFTHF